jgi:hypothetical protein
MAKKRGYRALFNIISRQPKETWTRGTFFQQDSTKFCDLGFVAKEVGAPVDEWATFGVGCQQIMVIPFLQEHFDLTENELLEVASINDNSMNQQTNIDAVKALAVHKLPYDVVLNVAKGFISLENALKIMRG